MPKLGLDSHETHTKNVDWSQREFGKDELFKADHLIDLMNNQIGRTIAKTKLSQSDYDKSVVELNNKGEDGLNKK